MAKDSCLYRVAYGVGLGGAIGGAVGTVYGTYDAFRSKVAPPTPFYAIPGVMKVRHIGQTTLGTAALFSLFLGAGSLIHCGRSY